MLSYTSFCNHKQSLSEKGTKITVNKCILKNRSSFLWCTVKVKRSVNKDLPQLHTLIGWTPHYECIEGGEGGIGYVQECRGWFGPWALKGPQNHLFEPDSNFSKSSSFSHSNIGVINYSLRNKQGTSIPPGIEHTSIRWRPTLSQTCWFLFVVDKSGKWKRWVDGEWFAWVREWVSASHGGRFFFDGTASSRSRLH